jgi:chloramphenicol 3-O phosphotransferase
MSKIIILNGAGSSGKSSLGRSIQHLSKDSWLTFGIDTFIEMTPYPSPGRTAEYFSFVQGENERGPLVTVESKESGDKLFGVMADFALLLANQSNNIIIDEVILNDKHLKSYVEKLVEHTVYFIAVKCDLHIMQEREYLRRDRAIGLSNGQYDVVHAGVKEYDLIVDTTNASVFEVAREILDFIRRCNTPKAFINMKNSSFKEEKK